MFAPKLATRGRSDYARRRDVDGWDADARASSSRPLGPTTLGFAYTGIERSWAIDAGEAFLRERAGIGLLKEIGWGLRPQVSFDVAHQVGDGPLASSDRLRRDWLLQASFSIYKRDWNIGGFAPSLSLTITRNYSTLSLYQERRIRGEIRFTKAF
jgi:outer membrane protein